MSSRRSSTRKLSNIEQAKLEEYERYASQRNKNVVFRAGRRPNTDKIGLTMSEDVASTDEWSLKTITIVDGRNDTTGIPGDVRVDWNNKCDGEYTMVGDKCIFADSANWLKAIGRGEIPEKVPARALLWQVSRPASAAYRDFARDLIADYSDPKPHTTYPDLLAAAYGVNEAVMNKTNIDAIFPALRKLFYDFGVKSKLRLMPFQWKVALIKSIVTEPRPWLVETVGGSLLDLVENLFKDSTEKQRVHVDGGDDAVEETEKKLNAILSNWDKIEELVNSHWAEVETKSGINIGEVMRDAQVQQVAFLLSSMAVLWSVVSQPDDRFVWQP